MVLKRNRMLRVSGPDDVPSVPHYALIVYDTTSVYIAGDERSRTCPGHGYPAQDVSYDTFEHWVTHDRAALEEAVKLFDEENRQRGRERKFVFFHASGKGVVKTSVEVEVVA